MNNISNAKVRIVVVNNINYSLSFKLIVEKVEYLYSMKILNDRFQPYRKIFSRFLLSRSQRWALSTEGDITLNYRPERLVSQRISASLKSFSLDAFTNQIHLPPVRAHSRLTKDKKYIGNLSPSGDDLPRSEDSAGRVYFLSLVKRECARTGGYTGNTNILLGQDVRRFRWGGIVPVW